MTPKELLGKLEMWIEQEVAKDNSIVLNEGDFKKFGLIACDKKIKESEYIESFNDFEFCKDDTYGSNFWKAVKEELEKNY
jgi:hypothetical protein